MLLIEVGSGLLAAIRCAVYECQLCRLGRMNLSVRPANRCLSGDHCLWI
jgi:hypothetical protein